MKKTLLRIAIILCVPLLVLTLFWTKKLNATRPSQPRAGLIIAADVPDAKWREIKQILSAQTVNLGASPRGELYRIRAYDGNGKYEESGSLPEKMLVTDFSDLPSKFKGHAIQIGVGALPDVDCYPPSATCGDKNKVLRRRDSKTVDADSSPSATPFISMHFRPNVQESQKMIEDVNKVLNSPDPASSPKP
jgi:hypothetical protein